MVAGMPIWTLALHARGASYCCRVAAGLRNGFGDTFPVTMTAGASGTSRMPSTPAGCKQCPRQRPPLDLKLSQSSGRRLHLSFVHKKVHPTDSGAAELGDLMRSIAQRGGGRRRGRTQDIVPKEAVGVFCSRYAQLDESGKEEILQSLASDFTPSPNDVMAAVNRYNASVAAGDGLGENTADGSGAKTIKESTFSGGRTGDELGVLPPAWKRGDGDEGDFGVSEQPRGGEQHVKAYEKLREELRPAYETLFRNIVAETDDGIRFVVNLRQDLLHLMKKERGTEDAVSVAPLLLALDGSLRALLQAWFSVGFLELRRITYEDSGGALLEKITRYEAVHPVRSLSELKHRLGRGRRCFAFFHPCLPGEPLVFVYVALLSEIAESMEQIRKGNGEGGGGGGVVGKEGDGNPEPPEEEARCAVFYSISSTQKGLQGVQLGNFLIKRVVTQLRAELPQLDVFATLSPIPSFREWLSKKAKHRAALIGGGQGNLSGEPLLTPDEAAAILSKQPLYTVADDKDRSRSVSKTAEEEGSRQEADALSVLLVENGPLFGRSIGADAGGAADRSVKGNSREVDDWSEKTKQKMAAAEAALTRLAARYLVRETVRGKILDPVGNFHVSNGARLERVNWMADTATKGIRQSFGLMVNYLYDPREIESNNRLYLSRGEVPSSDEVRDLAWSLRNRPMAEKQQKQDEPNPAGFL